MNNYEKETEYTLVAIIIYDAGIKTRKKMIKFVLRGSVEGYVDYIDIDVPADKAKKIYEHIKDKDIYNRLGQKIKMVVKNPFLHKVLQEKPDVS